MNRKVVIKFFFVVSFFLIGSINAFAHAGNITGYQHENSNKVSFCHNKYYAFHKQNDIYHYHEVVWNSEKEKWIILNKDEFFEKNPCGYENERVKASLSSCIDGDTAKFNLNNEVITARFLAIDTPETVHPSKEIMAFGKEASDYTCNKLKNAKSIILEYDSASDKYDKYNRHLVWVFVDNSLLQKELIDEGYGKIEYIYGDYKYLNELRVLEEKVKLSKKGIWSLEEYLSKDEESSNISQNTKDIFIYTFSIIIGVMAIVYKKVKFSKKKSKVLKKILQ